MEHRAELGTDAASRTALSSRSQKTPYKALFTSLFRNFVRLIVRVVTVVHEAV